MGALSENTVLEYAKKFQYGFEIRIEMELSGLRIKTPELELGPDRECYYSPKEHLIHIGTGLIVNLFHPETEEDVYEALEYVIGHEVEHIRSTSDRPYGIGIQKGCEEVVKYISSIVDKTKRRFRKQSDYEVFVNGLQKQGIYLNWRSLQRYVAGIANSLEDGRIERIRADRIPGFEKLRLKYRAKFWDAGQEPKPVDHPVVKLNNITNQVLSLATCQVYEKGFVKNFFHTQEMAEVESLMPNIAKGYIASSCRDMSVQVIEISKKLAPYLYEACKMAAMDVVARQMLEKALADMIAAAIESQLETGLSENDEMKGEPTSLPKSTFPVSDLVVTLPDDVYDKLMENSKESDEASGGIMVKREHPKEEEQKEEGNPSGGKSSAEGTDKSADKESSAGSEKTGDSSEEGQNCSKASENGAEEQGNKSGKTGEPGEDNSGEQAAESGEAADGESGSDDSKMDGSETGKPVTSALNESPNNGQAQREGKEEVNGDAKSAEALIREAMEKAAEQTHAEALENVSNVNTHNTHATRVQKSSKESFDKQEPLDVGKIEKDLGCSFVEIKRSYNLTDNLPPVIAARGRAMFRKNKRYFKSLSTPNISHLESGSVDPSRIYSLGFGDTEVFRKIGRDKKFDGCAYILLDNSGSMAGNKRVEASKAAAIVEEGFREMFPVKIVAFDSTGTINHEVIKGWDEWRNKNCCWNFCLHGRYGNGNEDGYDIQIATKELLARKEKHKMLIVLSDGAPGDRAHVRRAVKEARKKGIEVYSIYFEEGEVYEGAIEQFASMYEKDFVCCSLDELDENLYKLFKKFSRQ